jgi:hypothetical protein
MFKICSKCDIEKDISDFHKNKHGKFGVRSICKKCMKSKYKYEKKGRRCNPNFDMKSYQKEYQKKWREDNKDIVKEKKKNHYINNKENYKNQSKQYNRKRRYEDPIYRIIGNVRNLIKNSILRKFTNKSKKTINILGCDFIFFNNYITNLFDEFMTWENYGVYWEIVHIESISKALTTEDVIRMNHYSNLRPLKKKNKSIKKN